MKKTNKRKEDLNKTRQPEHISKSSCWEAPSNCDEKSPCKPECHPKNPNNQGKHHF